jgi:ATP-binding cassette subfamily C protein CydC
VRTILRLLRLMRPFTAEVLLSVLLGTATVASGIGLLGTSAFLIASAALQPGITPLQVAIVGVRFFGISRGVLRYLERLVSHSVNFRLLAQLRVWFYQAVEPLAPARLENYQGGDLLNRAVGDIEVLENFYVRVVAPPLVALLVTVGMGWFTGQYAVVLGMILAGGMLAAGLVLPVGVYLLTRRMGKAVTQSRAQLNSVFVEGVQGMADWILYGQEERILAEINQSSRQMEVTTGRLAGVGAAGGALGLLINHLTLWLALIAAISLVRAGQLDGVSLAVVALLTLASFEAALPLNQAAQQLESALQSARRLFELADAHAEVREPEQPLEPPTKFGVSVRNLTFQYPGRAVPALAHFNMELPPGKRVALVGPSGAGKSTVANLLLRFWDAPAGAIFVDGQDIRAYRAEDIRRGLAVIPQSPYLFSGTLAENLRMGELRGALSDDQVEKAAQTAGLGGLIDRLPNGLRGWVGAQGEQLSGGERQRVAAVRALFKEARLLILDEPAANLDAASARSLMRQVLALAGDCQVLWITHDLTGLEEMDEIVVLREGQVIERGTHAELTSQGGWFAQALELQRRVIVMEGTSPDIPAS